ncbi:MAG TPA: SDR family NAD(P)-dependent oxidoreductase [Acidiferrobacteraceae bacterium]|nr:SDR family NAD(P)-dependent oxidoreductase [Acidiferrobacteraceae bacterium]
MTQKKRKIIVTGASSGIGLAVCDRLLTDGHEVIGLSRRGGQTGPRHPNFYPESINLADLDALPQHLDELRNKHNNISGIIFSAGSGAFGSLEEFSYSQIRELIELNFTSQAYITRAFLPDIKKQGFGNLIYIGSEAALSGGGRGAIYSASKFALRGFAQALRQECAKSGIRITLINPGMAKTPFFDDLEFSPGPDSDNYILADDVADAVLLALDSRKGTVLDEINLSPQKKVIQKNRPDKSGP